MFTMAKLRDGSTYLEGHLTANDYYAEKESVTGHWVAKPPSASVSPAAQSQRRTKHLNDCAAISTLSPAGG